MSPNTEDAERAARIRGLMRDRGWTFGRLAEELGVSKGTVESWVYREVRPNWPHLAKLADVFDTTPGWLETGESDSRPADPVGALRYDVDKLQGQLAQNAERIRFIAANTQRITALEGAVAEGRRELAEVRELLEQMAASLLPLVTGALSGAADRRSSGEGPPGRAERRGSAGRRRIDPPSS